VLEVVEQVGHEAQVVDPELDPPGGSPERPAGPDGQPLGVDGQEAESSPSSDRPETSSRSVALPPLPWSSSTAGTGVSGRYPTGTCRR
jgi:hypothetical protein